jgi:diaminopimelate epimerase
MRLAFHKMQGAGNDVIVLDATRAPLVLSAAQMRFLADRRLGIGADQILIVESSPEPGIDFGYRIFNGGSGDEVEHCGNGARCFMQFVRETGLTDKQTVTVRTVNNLLQLQAMADGEVRVDMNRPMFSNVAVGFDATGLRPRMQHGFELWPLDVGDAGIEVAVLSMGNPHAVQLVHDVDALPLHELGPLVEGHPRFAQGVNAGYLQTLSRSEVKLRVFERGAGETLACGTGACAAVVAGIRLGLLDDSVRVHARGGDLRIEWAGGEAPVFMSGPAQTVFTGHIDVPDLPVCSATLHSSSRR